MRVVVLICAMSLAFGPSVKAQSGSSLVGTWHLVSWESRDSNGQVAYPMGRDATGQVIFDSAGNVSIQLMRRGRPVFASEDRAGGTPEQTRAAFLGYLAYYGRYVLDASTGELRIHVEGASFPNWVDTEQIRHITIDGSRFTGTSPPVLVAGRMVTGILVWERAP
jgi:Lipocalin-like domain